MANETESVVTIGHTTNGEEFLNTFIHELNHITTHLAKTLHINLDSEDIAYLAGDIAMKVSDIACKYSCNSCRNKFKYYICLKIDCKMKKIWFILLLFMVSCRTVYVDRPIETIVHDTLKVVQGKTDSIFVKDSIFVYKNGDTVLIYKYKDRYKDRFIHDTVYKHSADSTSYPVYIEKKVEVEYTPTFIKLLSVLGLLFICYIIYRVYRAFKILRQ